MFFALGGALIIVLAGYGGYRYWDLRVVRRSLEAKVAELGQSLAITEEALLLVREDNADLREALLAEQNKNAAFESQISNLAGAVGEISGTVGTLEKLRKIDPELLRKYSRVYFLSENYLPTRLAVVEPKYLYNTDVSELILESVSGFLRRMMDSAREGGIALKVVSAYRSFGEQSSLKASYKFTYGAGTANQFSADQGYSEHQLGSTVDLTSPEISGVFANFETTNAYRWLTQNAHRFGFTLSYPERNTYYQFEPWHWRFVGVALAAKLHNEDKFFYDLTQREINEYLVNIFD